MSLTGNTSNKDLDFLKASVLGLARTPEGNRLIISFMQKQNDFKIAIANEQQRLISENNGVYPRDLDKKMMEFADNYRMFTDEEVAEINSFLAINKKKETPLKEKSDEEIKKMLEDLNK